MKNPKFAYFTIVLFLVSCQGMKVIDPREEKDKGTMMVDWSGASPKVVGTYKCKLESGGNRFSALGKNEDEAKKEVLARCKDRTLLNFCKAENIKCESNSASK